MLSKFSIKKPFTILVAVVIVIVFGVIALTKMTPDLFPKINTPYVIVMTTYPGARRRSRRSLSRWSSSWRLFLTSRT